MHFYGHPLPNQPVVFARVTKFKERMKNVSRLKEDTETCKVMQCKNPDWNLYWNIQKPLRGKPAKTEWSIRIGWR